VTAAAVWFGLTILGAVIFMGVAEIAPILREIRDTLNSIKDKMP
jgi:hypothetical protein